MRSVRVAERPAVGRAAARLMVVGIRDAVRDAAVLAWAARDALAATDAIYVVHALAPSLHDDTDRRCRAARQVARAVEQLQVSHPDLPAFGSVLDALPGDVLIELSCSADLLVVGADAAGTALGTPHVALRVQEHARCPVACIPPDFERCQRPVTVAAADARPSEDAMRFAADYAQRHAATMQVARIELDDDWLADVAARSSLVVVAADVLTGDQRSVDPFRLHCPIVVVP